MARGWESKSVESQQDAAENRAPERPPLTDREQRVAALELSRKRVLAEMDTSRNPRFREMKQKALEHLERQIQALQV